MKKQQRLRIIGGQWRGRRFEAPDSRVRPTPDAVRETLFNWLKDRIPGARCLDLYAGSGLLGLEALSRGAASVDFVEAYARACRLLREHLRVLDSAQRVYHMDARRFVRQIGGQWDVIFLDPPFRHGMLDEIIALLDAHQCLHAETLLYIEAERELKCVTLPDGWAMLKTKQAGQITYGLYGSTKEHD